MRTGIGPHEFYNAGVLSTHVFLIDMSQNSVAGKQIHAAGDHNPLILPRHAYRAAGVVTCCRYVLTNCMIQMICNLQ